jgi:hypothetical protein
MVAAVAFTTLISLWLFSDQGIAGEQQSRNAGSVC